MPKNGFPMPTAKNGFHILNLHPKYMYLKIPFFNANILEKFQKQFKTFTTLSDFPRFNLFIRISKSKCYFI